MHLTENIMKNVTLCILLYNDIDAKKHNLISIVCRVSAMLTTAPLRLLLPFLLCPFTFNFYSKEKGRTSDKEEISFKNAVVKKVVSYPITQVKYLLHSRLMMKNQLLS